MTWLIPAAVTIAALGTAVAAIPEGRGDYNFAALAGCAYIPLAGCVSLTAWLVWALAA